jgi:hypothetical protein
MASVLRAEEVWTPPVYGREEFRRYYWHYKPGQHVLFAGPTQMAGKTTLAFQLLEVTATPDCPAFVAVSKPRDPVTLEWMNKLRYRLVREWPPPPQFKEAWGDKPSGYVIWPKFGDINRDTENAYRVTKALLDDRYAKGVKGKKGILVCDDTVVKEKILGLGKEMQTHIAMAGAMDLGGWYFTQKATGAGDTIVWSAGNTAHKFTSHESDKRGRTRYDEMGGFESQQVGRIIQNLKEFQFLYTNNKGEMCIVDKD